MPHFARHAIGPLGKTLRFLALHALPKPFLYAHRHVAHGGENVRDRAILPDDRGYADIPPMRRLMAIGRIPFEPVLLAATSSVESRQGLYSAFDRPEIDPSPVTDIGKIVETQNTQSVGIDIFQLTLEIDQHDTLNGLV